MISQHSSDFRTILYKFGTSVRGSPGTQATSSAWGHIVLELSGHPGDPFEQKSFVFKGAAWMPGEPRKYFERIQSSQCRMHLPTLTTHIQFICVLQGSPLARRGTSTLHHAINHSKHTVRNCILGVATLKWACD